MSKNVKQSEEGYKPHVDLRKRSEVQKELEETEDILRKSFLEEKQQKGRW